MVILGYEFDENGHIRFTGDYVNEWFVQYPSSNLRLYTPYASGQVDGFTPLQDGSFLGFNEIFHSWNVPSDYVSSRPEISTRITHKALIPLEEAIILSDGVLQGRVTSYYSNTWPEDGVVGENFYRLVN